MRRFIHPPEFIGEALPHILIIGDILIYYVIAHFEHMYTNFRRFFRLIFCDFYSAVISVMIPLVTVTVCEAVVNDPVAPVGRSPIVAI